MPADDVVSWFGRNALPLFAERYPQLFEPHDSTRSFVLTLNDIIHPEVRKLYPGADVPEFDFDVRDELLVMGYRSPRKLCSFAEGLLLGAADHYGERLTIEQPALHEARRRPAACSRSRSRDEPAGRRSTPGSRRSRSGCDVSGSRAARWRRSRSGRPERCMTSSRSSCCSRRWSRPPTRARPWRTRSRARSTPSAPTRRWPVGPRLPARARLGGSRAEHELAHRAAGSVRGVSQRDRADDVLRGGRASGPRARHGRGRHGSPT